MLETKEHFGRRLTTLGRKHQAMANGYTTQLRGDGLIVVKPKRARSARLPIKGFVLALMGFFAFKAFAVVNMGDITYAERVASLRDGTVVEQAGAVIMQIDPVTLALVAAYTEFSQ
ncbi:MAG: hypothetical protein AAGM84_13070 [Pseudomonadota bacterium]